MVKIQDVSVWLSGQIKTAKVLNLTAYDNLSTSANFYYELREENSVQEGDVVISGSVVASGNLSMTAEEYEAWDDSNAGAYAWVAGKLNVVIIP
jgi:hypothetical protein